MKSLVQQELIKRGILWSGFHNMCYSHSATDLDHTLAAYGEVLAQLKGALEAGDLAKLVFRISVDNADENVSVERMWVLVRERTPDGYLGVLDNEPGAIAENDEFWPGTELPFSAKHVINIEERDTKTIALAREAPRRRWTS